MTESDEAPIQVRDDGAIRVITLNRPRQRNAVNQAMADGLDSALTDFESDPNALVAVITGAGGHFSAGMDLAEFRSSGIPVVAGRGFAGIAERTTGKPIIAAVEGYALAGGFEITLACDVIVAANSGRFGLPEARMGLVAAAGGLVRLPDRVPYHLAMMMVLSGITIDAETAHRHGLVASLCADGTALGQAIELGHRIAANAPLSVRASKQVVTESRRWPGNEMFRRQNVITDPVLESADAREGAQAFLERRAPRWTGR